MWRLFLIFLIFLPINIFAQNSIETNYDFYVSPNIPSPKEEISLQILNIVKSPNTRIDWFVDGVLQKRDGDVSFKTTSGTLGQEIVVRAEIYRNDSFYGSAVERIIPLEIDIITEPTSYTPYRYRGLPIHRNGVPVNFTVLVNGLTPEGQQITINDVQFVWKKGSSYITDFAGERGLNQITTSFPIIGRDPLVTVENGDFTFRYKI